MIDRDRVFAISHSGRMVAIDLRRGDRVWEQEIASSHGPWVAGDYIYVLANDNELVCLTRNEGKVRWVQQLPQYDDPEKRKDPILWAGPVLGGDRLIALVEHRRCGVGFALYRPAARPDHDVGQRLSRPGHRRQRALSADRRRQSLGLSLAGGGTHPHSASLIPGCGPVMGYLNLGGEKC